MTLSQWERKDRREGPRVRLQLRLALVYPQQEGRPARPVFHGKSHDICMSGLSMVAEDNAFYDGEVTVLLALPPVHSWASQKIIAATAEMTYAIHSSKFNGFKIGLVFRAFKGAEKDLLEAALRHALKKAGVAGMQSTSARFSAHQPRDSQPLDW